MCWRQRFSSAARDISGESVIAISLSGGGRHVIKDFQWRLQFSKRFRLNVSKNLILSREVG